MYRYDFDYKQLYYLEGNLEAGYQVGRSEIKFGIRPSYLMSSKVRIASTEYNSISGSEEWSEEEQVYSFTKGLNRWGIKSSVGYAYHIKPDLEIGAQIGVQLMNSVDEEYIQGTPKMVPIDGQFYLRKNIGWKKK
jgi:hypothetical protein